MQLSQVKAPVDVLNEATLVVTTAGDILKAPRDTSYNQRVLIVDIHSWRPLNNYHSWFNSKFKNFTDKELEDEVKRRGLSW